MELGSSSSRSRSNPLSMALGCEQNKVVNIVLPYALPQTFSTILSALAIHG